MEDKGFRAAERAQRSIVAGIEKRCLVWLAARMPRQVNSDHLTLIGFLGHLGAGLSYWLARYTSEGLLLCILFLAINWFGDSLDGTLARMRNQQRPRYGFYVDHVVDTFGALFLLGGAALSNYMSLPVAAGLLISFYMLSIWPHIRSARSTCRSAALDLPNYASCSPSATCGSTSAREFRGCTLSAANIACLMWEERSVYWAWC